MTTIFSKYNFELAGAVLEKQFSASYIKIEI